MHKKLLTWLWLCGFAAMLCLDARAQGATAGQIKAAKVTGTVTATKEGKTITLQNGSELSQGYVVNTAKDASVVLVFSNGATLNLAQDSSLAIDEFLQDPFADEVSVAKLTAEPSTSTTKLNLSRGELVGNVKKLNYEKGSSFNIQTPVGAAGIRGTTFRIVFRPDGTGKAFFSLTTVEGNVVLAAGSVNLPADTSVPDSQEVAVTIDVTADPVTGALTLVVGSAPPIVIPASATTLADLAVIVQQVAQATATTTFTAPASVTGATTITTETPKDEPKKEETKKEDPPPPPPTTAPVRTTPTDGTAS